MSIDFVPVVSPYNGEPRGSRASQTDHENGGFIFSSLYQALPHMVCLYHYTFNMANVNYSLHTI